MGLIGNTYTTYDAKGIRENLTENIYNISPEDTPISSGFPRGGAESTFKEWQVDALAAASSDNAQLDGDEFTFDQIVPTSRVGSYTQISRKAIIVSGTEEAVNKAGRKSDMAYESAKKAVELKLDIEKTILSNQGTDAGAVGTKRRAASLLAWIKSNVSKASDGVNPIYTNIPTDVRTDGTQRALTEDLLVAVLQAGWTEGAKFRKLYTGPVNKDKVAGFDGVASKVYNLNQPGDTVAVVNSVDVYVSNFGTVDVIPTRLQRERDAFLIDPNMGEMFFLRPFFTKPLADTGDSTKRGMIVEWGLKVNNELGLGAVYDLTTT